MNTPQPILRSIFWHLISSPTSLIAAICEANSHELRDIFLYPPIGASSRGMSSSFLEFIFQLLLESRSLSIVNRTPVESSGSISLVNPNIDTSELRIDRGRKMIGVPFSDARLCWAAYVLIAIESIDDKSSLGEVVKVLTQSLLSQGSLTSDVEVVPNESRVGGVETTTFEFAIGDEVARPSFWFCDPKDHFAP